MTAVTFSDRPTFAIVGLEATGPAAQGRAWIPPLWQQAGRRFAELHALPTGPAWGLMSAVDAWLQPWTDRGRYLAGWQVPPGTAAPAGWTVWEIPGGTFASIECTLAGYGDALARLRAALAALPEGEPAGAIHEYYPRPLTDAAATLELTTLTRRHAR